MKKGVNLRGVILESKYTNATFYACITQPVITCSELTIETLE